MNVKLIKLKNLQRRQRWQVYDTFWLSDDISFIHSLILSFGS